MSIKNKNLQILKIGGKVLESESDFLQLTQTFANWKSPKILVHGGGKAASELSKKMGVEPILIEGRRLTDAAALDIAVMVYAGLMNKKVVARLQALQCSALGLTGADLNSISAHKRPIKEIDYGWVGDINVINISSITSLLELGITPVFCAITHDQKGQLLNTNADSIAAALAVAFSNIFSVTLHYCFDRVGVLTNPNDDTSIIKELRPENYKNFKEEGIIYDGMIPKLDNAFQSLKDGVHKVVLSGVYNLGGGTTILLC